MLLDFGQSVGNLGSGGIDIDALHYDDALTGNVTVYITENKSHGLSHAAKQLN